MRVSFTYWIKMNVKNKLDPNNSPKREAANYLTGSLWYYWRLLTIPYREPNQDWANKMLMLLHQMLQSPKGGRTRIGWSKRLLQKGPRPMKLLDWSALHSACQIGGDIQSMPMKHRIDCLFYKCWIVHYYAHTEM